MYEEVVAGQTVQRGPAHIDTLNSKAELTEILVQQHELEAAAALIQPAIEALLRPVSPMRFLYADSRLLLALPQVSQCDDERRGTGFVSIVLAQTRSIHGEILSLRGDTSAARLELEMALKAQIRIGPENSPKLLETRRRLAKVGERAVTLVQSAAGQRRERGKAARNECQK